jgi:hypothetical protein
MKTVTTRGGVTIEAPFEQFELADELFLDVFRLFLSHPKYAERFWMLDYGRSDEKFIIDVADFTINIIRLMNEITDERLVDSALHDAFADFITFISLSNFTSSEAELRAKQLPMPDVEVRQAIIEEYREEYEEEWPEPFTIEVYFKGVTETLMWITTANGIDEK